MNTAEATSIELYAEIKQQYPQANIIVFCQEEDMYVTFAKGAEAVRKICGPLATFDTRDPETGKYVQSIAFHESEIQPRIRQLMKAEYRIAITRPRI